MRFGAESCSQSISGSTGLPRVVALDEPAQMPRETCRYCVLIDLVRLEMGQHTGIMPSIHQHLPDPGLPSSWLKASIETAETFPEQRTVTNTA